MMKALILTGGLGTRLRPFTLSVPKPLLSVVNRPFIHYQLDNLKRHGIRDVTLATAYRPEQFRRTLGSGRGIGMQISYVHEKQPLGTGGAVRNALKKLDGTTLILNGDVLQALDISALLKLHRRSRSEVTLTLTPVKDPTRFGLVETNKKHRIRRFLEKPSPDEITCNTINAGAYLFEPSAVELIPKGRPYSLERGLFPRLLEMGRPMFAYTTKNYWLDFGNVEKYLQIHLDILGSAAPFMPDGLRRKGAFYSAPGAKIHFTAAHKGPGRVVLGRAVRIGKNVRFTGSSCLGDRTVIGDGAIIEDCVILKGTRVGAGARLTGCIVGHDCRLGSNVVVSPGRALGAKSVIQEYSIA